MQKWVGFFEPFFFDRSSAESFIRPIEEIDDPDSPQHRAKIMMHQAQRLVSLADDMQEIRPGKQALQLLFLLICAEHTAKLHANHVAEGRSRAFTRKFFTDRVLDEDQQVLIDSFVRHGNVGLSAPSIDDIVNGLYDVRCDVVHEGKYWGFHFAQGGTAMLNLDPHLIAGMHFETFRAIVVRGCINAIKSSFGEMTPDPLDALAPL